MRVLGSIPAHDLNAVGAAAKEVEAKGFSGISTQENRHDAFLPLAIAATNTSTLELRTSISIAFARSPMSSAMLAWDLQASIQWPVHARPWQPGEGSQRPKIQCPLEPTGTQDA